MNSVPADSLLNVDVEYALLHCLMTSLHCATTGFVCVGLVLKECAKFWALFKLISGTILAISQQPRPSFNFVIYQLISY